MEGWMIGALAAVAVGLLVLLLRRGGRRKPAGGALRPLETPTAAWQQRSLELDPQTRFLETRKPKQYRLLNDAEQNLYLRLVEAMPNMRIFAQVGVAQLALLRGRRDAQQLREMSGRGVDFVVCGEDFSLVAAIELVWPRTEGDGLSPAEEEKRLALESLGLPLIVFRPNNLPDADTISREVAAAILRRNRLEAARHG